MQKLNNKYYKHKYFNSIIKTSVRMGMGDISLDPKTHHLYIDLVQGDRIVGMDGNKTFMLSTCLHQNEWNGILNEWIKENLYLDYNPFLMNETEADRFLNFCNDIAKQRNQPLGQVIINELGHRTPTPNDEIYNSTDQSFILAWFYNNYLIPSKETA